jgi:hypothetical protein
MNYKIEKNVPKYNKWIELASKMEVGDSILFQSVDKTRTFKAALNKKSYTYKGVTCPDGYRLWRES